jgi:hypothetical protein
MTDSQDDLIRRIQQLEQRGYASMHAFQRAILEMRVEQWPPAWGDDFVVLLFGDFNPPDKDLNINTLGITIEKEKVTNSVVSSTALTVLKARVAVTEKSVAAVKDAVRSYTNQGSPVRWWSHIVSPSGGGLIFDLADHDPNITLSLIELLPPQVRKRVTAALYWIREPRGMVREHHRSDQLAVYAGYWNAFECLVDAADDLVPRVRSTRSAKIAAIQTRLQQAGPSFGPADVEALYREIVDPGLRVKAEHALHVCVPLEAAHFLKQAFDYEPKDHRLYTIRNAINHGTIDVDDPETVMFIETRFVELWKLVFLMLKGVLHVNLQQKAQSSP